MSSFMPRRRALLRAALGLGTAALAARSALRPNVAAASPKPEVTVYKDPSCGCCSAWVAHLEASGYRVTTHDRPDIPAIKQRLGVPPALQACHTAVVGDYVVEGHVPATDIERLLATRPEARGLAVPGMPLGSPGMQFGDRRQAYRSWLFGAEQPRVFAEHPAGTG